MSLEFNIPAVYSDTFGLYGQLARFPAVSTNESRGSAGEFKVPEIAKTESQVLSSLGTPVESPIFFEAGEYRMFDLDGTLIKVKRNELMLPPTSLIEVSRSKRVKELPTNNGNEEITTLYGHNSWRIRIYGVALPETNKTPKQQLNELLGFENLMDSIKVRCSYLLEYGITEITILDIASGQVKGMPNARAFQINAKSEKPAELTIR